jgi:broad specificity phosphatase PhoE
MLTSLALLDEGLIAIAISSGLFVGTVLLSIRQQQIKIKNKQPPEPNAETLGDYSLQKLGDNGVTDDGDFQLLTSKSANGRDNVMKDMEWYRKRRMEDRMSFHEIYNYQIDTFSRHKSRQSDSTGDRLGSSDTCVEALRTVGMASNQQDFPAINQSNWNHFEGFQRDADCSDDTNAGNVRSAASTLNEKNISIVKSSQPILRETSIGSDAYENLTKMLEGEDLRDEQLCPDDTTQHVIIDEIHQAQNISKLGAQHQSTSFPSVNDEQSTTRQKPRLEPPLLGIPHLRRSHSVDAPLLKNDDLDNYFLRNRIARTQYNASIMPSKLILVRHGQSLGNVDERLYATTPDNAMPLTELGWEQAKAAGIELKRILSSTKSTTTTASSNSECGSVHFILSPYVRTVETFHGIVAAWCDPSEFSYIEDHEQRLNAWYSRLMECGLTWNEDPRIREQDFGNYQEPEMIKQAKRDRHMFGAFYFRFPLGESASDVSVHTF